MILRERLAACVDGGLAASGHLPLDLLDQSRQRRLGIRRHLQVDVGRVALQTRAVVAFRRQSDRGDADRLGALLQRRSQVTAFAAAGDDIEGIAGFQHQQHVCFGDQRPLAARLIQWVSPGEVHPVLAVADRRLQRLSELDHQFHARGCPRRSIRVDHRTLGVDEQGRRFPDRARFSRGRDGMDQLRYRRSVGRATGNLVLLHHRVDRQQGWPIRRRHGELVRAHGGLAEVAQRARRVVPLGKVTNHRRAVGSRMRPRHFPDPLADVRKTARHHEDGHPVGIGVVDRHGAVLQTNGRVHHAGHGLALDFGVAVSHRHGSLFVHGADGAQPGLREHAVVDHGLVQTHKSVARRSGEILDAEAADHIDHVVAAATGKGHTLEAGCRFLRGSVWAGRTGFVAFAAGGSYRVIPVRGVCRL